MVAGEIELKETELVVLQNLLGGDNFGAGYDDFSNKNMNIAQFKAQQRGNVFQTALVEKAIDDGRLSRLDFRIEADENDDNSERQIKVVADREGYFRSRQKAPDELLDRFFGNLAIVLEYRDKLVPIDKHIDKYIENLSLGMGKTRRSVDLETNRAFKELIKNDFTAIDYEQSDILVYKSIISNTGIALCDLNLGSDDYPNLTLIDGGDINYQNRIEDFFEVYSINVGSGVRPDFDLLATHLNYILTYSDGYDSLTEMLAFIEDTYGI